MSGSRMRVVGLLMPGRRRHGCPGLAHRSRNPPLLFRSAPDEVWRDFAGAQEVAVRPIRIDAAPLPEEITLSPHLLSRAG